MCVCVCERERERERLKTCKSGISIREVVEVPLKQIVGMEKKGHKILERTPIVWSARPN